MSTDLVTQEVDLSLPKFKLAARYDMKDLLSDMGIPQENQLFHPSNLLTDHLKQTGIMEPLITD